MEEQNLPEEIMKGDGAEVNDSPIEQVRLTVSIKDDPSQPALTFRTWVLGLISCILLAFANQFFGYRQNQIGIGSVCVQILALPLGKLMAATLPTRTFTVCFTNWSFSMNPGPFNLKEHVLITIFASCGSSGAYALDTVTMVKAFYHRNLHFVAALVLVMTSQLIGYGWAGLFRKHLVDSPYMWWPGNLVQVSLFSALHDTEKRPKGGRTRMQFFLMVFVASFAYYIVPGYLFPSLTALSFVCWIWKDSVRAQQIGSGMRGLGIGSFTLDWSTIAGFLGSPLSSPGFAIVNTLVGFALTLYVLVPIAYWSNLYSAKTFPLFSSHTFDNTGHTYNITRILNAKTFDLNEDAYNNYSKVHLSVLFALQYGLNFAALAATISHVGLFHGKTIWGMWKKTTKEEGDVHTRLMKKNYEAVPQWWFQAILVSTMGLSLLGCLGFHHELQLPLWGLILACAIAFVFTYPMGVINATTNWGIGINVISEMIIGYLYPGKPMANATFKTYGTTSMSHALVFLGDFKLGHYMKIPPKSMFIVQLVGTIVGSSVSLGTAWWLLSSVKHICDLSQLPEGSPWTCPGDDVFYSASIIWGVVGPQRMFTSLGIYGKINWFFLAGFLAPVPVWLLSRRFPNQKWIMLINMPIIIGGGLGMPPARAINFLSWGVVGIFFNVYIFRKYKGWWARHTYVMSTALDAGLAFMGILLFFALQAQDIVGPAWWGLENGDHCPLATCPTAPGVFVQGCPLVN